MKVFNREEFVEVVQKQFSSPEQLDDFQNLVATYDALVTKSNEEQTEAKVAEVNDRWAAKFREYFINGGAGGSSVLPDNESISLKRAKSIGLDDLFKPC